MSFPMLPVGTLVNVAAILAGGTVGLLLGARLPPAMTTVLFQGLGLSTLVLGFKLALQLQEPLVVIFSLLLGGMAGAAVGLEDLLASMGDRIKDMVGSRESRFTDGLITAFLLFCVGSMTILGAMEEGLRGEHTIYFTKALLDGFASIALASTYGAGVLFAAVPVFLYQYGLTLGAAALQDAAPPALVTEVSAVGGMLIIGIGINLLGLARIKLGDLLPSLLVVVVLYRLVH